MNYMGIDHHKQYSHLTLVDKRGKEIKSGRVENLRREVEEFLNGVEGKIVAAIEAGRSSYTMVDLMKGLGVEVKVAGSGPVVKAKNKSFLRCMSLIMPLSFTSDDKPQRAYHISLRIDATSLGYIFE